MNMKKRFTVATLALVMVLGIAAGAVGGMTISVDPINIQVNGQTFQPKDVNGNDVPVFAYNGTTYAPLRALAEAYGLTVGYDAAANMATVTDPKAAGTTTPAAPSTPAAPLTASSTPVGAGTYSFNAVTDVTGSTDDNAKLAAGTTFANGALTVVINDAKNGKVLQRVKEGSVYCVQVEKDQTSALEFTVTGTADVTVKAASTGGSNTSMVGIVKLDGTKVANNEGVEKVSGTSQTTLTYTGLAAGTYQIVSLETDDETMNRGVRIHSVDITVK